MKVVVNATPLISLALVDRLNLLKVLFEEIIVPNAVYDEVVRQGAGKTGADQVARLPWLTVMRPDIYSGIDLQLFGLDTGETEVLLLAQQIQPDWVIIDERLARRVALAMGLPVKGTLGLLLSAVQGGVVAKEDALNDLQHLSLSGIRISSRLLRWFQGELEKDRE